MCSGATKIDGIPVNNSTDDQIEAGSPECLAVVGAITDFTALVEKRLHVSACVRLRPC